MLHASDSTPLTPVRIAESERTIRAAVILFACAVLVTLVGCSESRRSASATPSGSDVFAENCAVCHALPILDSLFEQNRGRPPGFVYDVLTEGNMRRVGGQLDEASRRAVAEFFTGVPFASSASERTMEVSPKCSAERSRFDWEDIAYPNWGRSVRNQRSIPGEEGFTRDQVERLSVEWVVAFPEASQLRSHPTAAGGALFVGSHNGSVYSLDQETGCTRWHFKAATEVRSAVTIDIDTRDGDRPFVRAVFADRAANAYALDAITGRLLWTRSVDPHPNAAITGSVTAHDGMFFVPVSSNDDVNSLDPDYPCCTHRGAVVALDARSGEILWRTSTIAEEPRVSGRTNAGTAIWGPSGASVWNTPTIAEKHGLLFVGSGNNHSRPATSMSDSILAMETRTGRIVWTYQAQAEDAWNAACVFGNRTSCPDPEGPDTDFGATTMLLELEGRDLLVAGQKSGMLHALDPATGELVWKKRVARGGPEAGIRYGMATQGGVLYVPSTDQGPQRVGGMSARPGFFALSAADGSTLWSRTGSELCAEREPCEGAMAAPPLVMPDVIFAAAVDGVVHALDRRSGEGVWSFETAQSFTTLLGHPTQGGGINGTAGPMYANGRLTRKRFDDEFDRQAGGESGRGDGRIPRYRRGPGVGSRSRRRAARDLGAQSRHGRGDGRSDWGARRGSRCERR
jgi:polyvinyl alcohol dehydrogenase (cytochrome)